MENDSLLQQFQLLFSVANLLKQFLFLFISFLSLNKKKQPQQTKNCFLVSFIYLCIIVLLIISNIFQRLKNEQNFHKVSLNNQYLFLKKVTLRANDVGFLLMTFFILRILIYNLFSHLCQNVQINFLTHSLSLFYTLDS